MLRGLFIGLWALLFIFGLWGLYERLASGHEAANYNNYVVWGLHVSAYIWFAGLSAGSFLFSSAIYVFRLKQLEPIGKLALFTALVALFAALLSIWFDIGRMERFWEVYTRGNWRSMMAWMIWLYTIYSLLVAAELWFVMRADLARWAGRPGLSGLAARLLSLGRRSLSEESLARDRRVVVALATIGIPLTIAFNGGVGALFGVIMARPYWNNPMFPLVFLSGALLSGAAFFSMMTAFFWPRRGTEEQLQMIRVLGRAALGLLIFYLFLEWAEFSIGMYYSWAQGRSASGEAGSFWMVVAGPYPWVFWGVHVLLGSVVPLILLITRPRRWAVGLAGFLVIASFLAVRLNIVIPALALPQLEGLEKAYTESHLTLGYFPSLMEWGIFALVGAIAVAAFYLGYRYLPIVPEKEKLA